MLVILALAAGVCAGDGQGQQRNAPVGTRKEATMATLQGKKVLMVIAAKNFRDEELLKPYAVLTAEGAQVTIACSTLSPVKGMLGHIAKPDLLLKDAKVDDYDAVVFVGGVGAVEYWNNPTAHAVVKAVVASGKVLGAICMAPVTLANAGVLQGRRATVWESEGPKLTARGAKYYGTPLEVDGKIITADGPTSAEAFGRAIAQALTK